MSSSTNARAGAQDAFSVTTPRTVELVKALAAFIASQAAINKPRLSHEEIILALIGALVITLGAAGPAAMTPVAFEEVVELFRRELIKHIDTLAAVAEQEARS